MPLGRMRFEHALERDHRDAAVRCCLDETLVGGERDDTMRAVRLQIHASDSAKSPAPNTTTSHIAAHDHCELVQAVVVEERDVPRVALAEVEEDPGIGVIEVRPNFLGVGVAVSMLKANPRPLRRANSSSVPRT